MLNNQKIPCCLCKNKIEIDHPQNKNIFAPGDSIYLIPSYVCFHCRSVHRKNGDLLLNGKKIVFFKNKEFIFLTIKEILNAGIKKENEIGFNLANKIRFVDKNLFVKFIKTL